MTLDEAIQHAKDVANEEKSKLLKVGEKYVCSKCAEEHEQLAEWLEELKEYKDLEERELLLKLPCKIGDTVWAIEKEDIGLGWNPEYVYCIKQEKFNATMVGFFGKDIFLTKEEAENELKRLEGVE
jgi:hypothetical protein